SRANAMPCCICGRVCNAFTTNLRKHEGLNMRPRWKKLVFIIPVGIVAIALFIFIGGELVMHLWNWLLPPLFGWRLLKFRQGMRGRCGFDAPASESKES